MSRPRTLSGIAFMAVCVLLTLGLSLWLGQEASWNLRNYHFYDPHAWLIGRSRLDIAPAQLQSFFNPTGDIPFYLMVRAGWPSWLIGAVLALPAAAALFLLSRVALLLLPPRSPHVAVLAMLVLAATGAAGGPLIGATMGEWHLDALFLGAILVALTRGLNAAHAGASSDWRSWLLCGFLVALRSA